MCKTSFRIVSPHVNLQDIMSESRGKGKEEQGTGCERRFLGEKEEDEGEEGHGAGQVEDAQGKFLETQPPAESQLSIFGLGIRSEEILVTVALLSDSKGSSSLKRLVALLW